MQETKKDEAKHAPTISDQTITIVSGLPRSGTSMMMRALRAGGMPLLVDGVRKPDADNPDGYFELERVKKTADDPSWLAEAEGKAVKLIAQLLFHLPAGHKYKIVFMRRAVHEVLASQRTMLDRQGVANTTNDEEMRPLLIRHVLQIEDWLRRRHDLQTLFVSYNRMLSDPLPQAERINRFLGGRLSPEAMAQVVNPDLYRQRAPVA